MAARARAGAAVGATLSVALLALSYAGWKLGGLPFVPFDLFDWLTRLLPGPVVTFWIDLAVVMLRALHAGSTAAAAKSAEQTIAIAMFLAAGTACGAAAFAALRVSNEPAVLLGGVLGGSLGFATLVVERTLERIQPGAHLDAVWIVTTFLAWGIALGYVHDGWRAAGEHAIGRRAFLIRVSRLVGAPAAIAAVCGAMLDRGRATRGARWSDTHALPNAGAPIEPVPGTRPEFTPLERHYRIDVDTRPPAIDATKWRLRIHGLVDRPQDMSLEDLRRDEPRNQFITLACISNPIGGDLIGTTRWTGVSLARVLARAQPQESATHVRVKSADGFFEVVSLDLVLSDPRVMLAYAWDDVPLTVAHGFPLRIYIPDVYGMKQPKWIDEIELMNHWEPGYWVERGWDRDGRMVATSVVDTANFDASRSLVVAGGIAHAGARGISHVEARLDDGEWTAANLRDPMSDTTWVVWRAALPASSGHHLVSVRCVDGDNVEQAPPFHVRQVGS